MTRGNFLYVKTDSLLVLRLTVGDGAGGTTQVLLPVHGLTLLEFSAGRELQLLEAQGQSKLEYFVSGQS